MALPLVAVGAFLATQIGRQAIQMFGRKFVERTVRKQGTKAISQMVKNFNKTNKTKPNINPNTGKVKKVTASQRQKAEMADKARKLKSGSFKSANPRRQQTQGPKQKPSQDANTPATETADYGSMSSARDKLGRTGFFGKWKRNIKRHPILVGGPTAAGVTAPIYYGAGRGLDAIETRNLDEYGVPINKSRPNRDAITGLSAGDDAAEVAQRDGYFEATRNGFNGTYEEYLNAVFDRQQELNNMKGRNQSRQPIDPGTIY